LESCSEVLCLLSIVSEFSESRSSCWKFVYESRLGRADWKRSFHLDWVLLEGRNIVLYTIIAASLRQKLAFILFEH